MGNDSGGYSGRSAARGEEPVNQWLGNERTIKVIDLSPGQHMEEDTNEDVSTPPPSFNSWERAGL